MFSFISSALGGSLLGGILSLFQKWADVKAKGMEADIEIRKMESMARLKVTEGELAAFTTSQQANEDIAIPENTPVWVSAIRVLVDSFRAFTRPGLTWAMIVTLSCVIFGDKLGITATEAVISDFVFTTSTAVMWWFGSRPLARTAK